MSDFTEFMRQRLRAAEDQKDGLRAQVEKLEKEIVEISNYVVRLRNDLDAYEKSTGAHTKRVPVPNVEPNKHLAGKQSFQDRVVRILNARFAREFDSHEAVDAVKDEVPDVDRNTVLVAISRAVKNGHLTRERIGRYKPVSLTLPTDGEPQSVEETEGDSHD